MCSHLSVVASPSSLVVARTTLHAVCLDAAMEDEQHQFVHAKLPVHSQYDRDRL